MRTMKRGALASALILFTATGASAQLTPEQVTSLQTVSSVAISPDARWVAYTLAQPRAAEEDTLAGLRGYSEVWVVPAAGGAAKQIVGRPNSAGGLAWTPAGELSFVRSGQVFMTITTPVTYMLLVRAALYRDRAEGRDPLGEDGTGQSPADRA